MFCYRYDANEGRYVIVANRVMRIGAGGIALVFGIFLAMFWYRERKQFVLRRASSRLASGDVGAGASPVNATVTPMETRT